MNHYELLAIISGKYSEPEAVTVLQSIEEIVKKFASAFHYSQNLERKKLAYPIKNHSYGTYVLVEFDGDPTMLKKIDQELKNSNEIIRHQIYRRETVGSPKDFERKEQERDTRRSGETEQKPIVIAPLVQPAPSPVYARKTSLEQEIQEETAPQKKESVTSAPQKEESTPEPAPITAPVKAVSAEEELLEPKAEEKKDDGKKKQKKVTYKELDEKLDEILNNTIL